MRQQRGFVCRCIPWRPTATGLFCRLTESDDYGLWHLNIDSGYRKPLHRVLESTLDPKHQLIRIGDYILGTL